MQLNGIAHIYLTVRDFERCLPFYEKLLSFFDMQCLVKTDVLFYCVGSRTGGGHSQGQA
jgi:predicted enzyme related to lactoylglutathione lyase